MIRRRNVVTRCVNVLLLSVYVLSCLKAVVCRNTVIIALFLVETMGDYTSTPQYTFKITNANN